MKFDPTPLADAWVVDLTPHGDDRGYFARAFCAREFAEHGLEARVVQSNTSYSVHAGTLRGMHFQRPPAEETKLVRCTRGAVLDVIIDLRRDSPTYRRHFGTELTADNLRMMFVPRGFAHGFMTLADRSEVVYMTSEYYSPEHEGGVRHDDPAFGITWPREVTVISDKDRNWPLVGE